MPDYVYEAHEIEDKINDKAGTRDLDDDDLVDEVIEVSSDNEIENVKPVPKKTVVKKEPGKFGCLLPYRRPPSVPIILYTSSCQQSPLQFIQNLRSCNLLDFRQSSAIISSL